MDAKQNISSIRHFLKKRHWVSDVFAGMCLYFFIQPKLDIHIRKEHGLVQELRLLVTHLIGSCATA